MEAGPVGSLGVPALWPAGEESKVEAELVPNHRQPMGGTIVKEMVWWRARATKILVQVNLYHLLKYLMWHLAFIHSDLRSEKKEKLKTNKMHKKMESWMGLFRLQVFFPISDHVMFSWEFSFCLFISYAYVCTCIWLFPRVASRGVRWESKTYKLERSIDVERKCIDFDCCVIVL